MVTLTGMSGGAHRAPRRAVVHCVLVGALSMGALAACGGGGSGNAAVTVAQARVSTKEKAVADAKSNLVDASATFCTASASYITTLDRYGDVLTQTTPTVGDVTDAGSDLEQPRQEVMGAAAEAVAAQEAVTVAKQDLADAEAALAEAKHPESSAPTSPSSTKSPKPLAPSASVNRVRQADSEFTAAQQGISARTPLTQASQQFNAAAVALEMAWLRLFSDAGCLTEDQQVQAEAAVRAYTTTLQTSLNEAGYYDGAVDGVYGTATVDAVESLQQAHGLPATGTVDKATAGALQGDLAAKGGAAAQDAAASTAAVQQTLKLAGFWDGPVDGAWTPALTQALKSFQTELGVKPTGTVDAATVAAFEKAITEAQAAGTPSPTATPSTPPSSSAPTAPVS